MAILSARADVRKQGKSRGIPTTKEEHHESLKEIANNVPYKEGTEDKGWTLDFQCP